MRTRFKYLLKALLCFVLIAAMFVAIAPKNVEAATPKLMPQGTYVTFKPGEKYKITIPANGYIKVYNPSQSWEVSFKKSGQPETALYTNKTQLVPTNTGTYYIRNGSDSAIKLKYKYVKVANTTNYCMKRASALAAGKTKTICVNNGREFDRWYKIKLTKSKTITLYTHRMHYDLSIYNSEFEEFSCSPLEDGKLKSPKLPKGTYYLWLPCGDPHVETIKWR